MGLTNYIRWESALRGYSVKTCSASYGAFTGWFQGLLYLTAISEMNTIAKM
jgi:hypothetical protein